MNLEEKLYNNYINPSCSHIHVGSGVDLTIKELVEIIKEVVGFKGKIFYDTTKPDGIPRKFLDSELINTLNFKPEISLKEGLINTYKIYLENYKF